MSVTHRGRSAAPPPSLDQLPASPPASRLARRRWQDPRLWLGVLLVGVSVVVGARVLAAADDTVAVWQVTTDLEAGAELTTESVALASVHFDDEADADAYVAADEPLPTGLRLARPVGSGELLPSSAITGDEADVPRQLPLGVTAAGIPTGLSVGDRVEVWAVPPTDAEQQPAAQRVLTDVFVVGMSESGPSGLSADRQVVVAVPDSVDLARTLDALAGATIVLVRTGG